MGGKQHKKKYFQMVYIFNNLDEYTSFQKNLKTKREIPIMQKAVFFFNPIRETQEI